MNASEQSRLANEMLDGFEKAAVQLFRKIARMLLNRLPYRHPDSVPSDASIVFIPGPIDFKSLAPDVFQIDKTPKSAVVAHVPVVPQNEQFSRGDATGPKLSRGIMEAGKMVLSVKIAAGSG